MALLDTFRAIRALRTNGYQVTRVRDNTGRLAWDVFYRNIYHNFTTNTNEIHLRYLGKIERYGNPDINNWSPFGRPNFYVTWHPLMKDEEVTRNATEIVRNSTPRAIIKQQWEEAA